MMLSVLAALVFCLIVAVFILLTRAHHYGSPVFWYPLAMGLIAVPTFFLIDFTHPSDVTHITAYLVGVLSFAAAAVTYSQHFNLGQALAQFSERAEEKDSQDAVKMSMMLLATSIIVTIVYFWLVGFNLLFLLLAGSVLDYTALRLSAYSGESYFAPGYVNQFKNTLYPILVYSGLLWVHRKRSKWRWPASIVSIGFGVFALLGTGQRVYILFAISTSVYGFYLLNLGRRAIPLKMVMLVAIPGILLFSFMTVAYKEIAGAGLAQVIDDVVGRFLWVQQEGGLVGFRYIADRESPWFEEWIKGIIGILPGREGSLVAHEVHGEMYGSTRGTVPLTAVGSAYQNAGLTGIVVMFAFLGLLYSYIYHRYLRGPRTVLRALSYGALFFYLSTYVVGPPESLIDSGIVAIVGLLLLRRVTWLPSNQSANSLLLNEQTELGFHQQQ